MATLKFLIDANAESATAVIDKMRARLDELGKSLKDPKAINVDDKAAAAKLLKTRIAADGLRERLDRPMDISLRGAGKAEAQLLSLEATAKKLDKTVTLRERVTGAGKAAAGLIPSDLGRVAGGAGIFAGGAGALAAAAPLAAATVAAGAFGAVAIPVLTKVAGATATNRKAAQSYAAAITSAKNSYAAQVTAAQHSLAVAKTAAQRQAALNAEHKASVALSQREQAALTTRNNATVKLSKSEQGLRTQLSGLEKMWGKVEAQLAPVVAQVLKLGVGVAKDLLPSFSLLVQSGGQVLMSVLRPMGALFKSNFFAGFIQDMTEFADQAGPLLGKTLVALLRLFMHLFISLMPAGLKILNALLPAIIQLANGLVPIINWVAKLIGVVVTWLAKTHLLVPVLFALGAAMTVGFGPLGWVVTGIALVIRYHTQLWAVIKRVWADIKAWVSDAVHWITDSWGKWLLPGLYAIIKTVQFVRDHWAYIWGSIRKTAEGFWQFLYWGFYGDWKQLFLTTIPHLWDQFTSATRRVWDGIIGWFKGVPGKILRALEGLGTSLWDFAHSALVKFWNGAKAAWEAVVHWFSGLPSHILHALGIHSPPDWAISAGKHIMGGLLRGLGLGHGSVIHWVSGLGGKIGNMLSAAIGVAGGGVIGTGQWRGVVDQALRMLNLPLSLGQRVLYQMASESGGNPRAINLWDTNAMMGDPSRGLMQVIGCVPLSTRILTRRGWLQHDEVRPGDETIGYNPASGRSEWTPVTRVLHYEDARVLRIGNGQWHADVTPDHRWWSDTMVRIQPAHETCPECGWVPRGTRQPARGVQVHRNKIHGVPRAGGPANTPRGEFVRTTDLGHGHRIRVAAVADTDGIPGLSVEDAAVIGWLMGDGHVSVAENGQGWDASIYQSKPAQVERIRALLAYVPHTEVVRQRRPGILPAHQFRLRRAYVTGLLKRAGWPERSPERFVLALSADQRAGWLAAMIDAEGHTSDGFTRIAQNDGDVAEAIRLAVYLEGWRPTYSRFRRTEPQHGAGGQFGMARPHIAPAMFTEQEPQSRQPVWCVETGLGTWTMWQDGGQPCLTGNSTFQRFHVGGTPWDIYNPLANVAAAINYALHTYGPALMSGGMGIGSGHGYALGTLSAAPGWAWVGERGRELVRFRGGEQVLPHGAAPAAVAASPRGPVVSIGEAHFHDEADLNILSQRLSFAVTSAGLGA